MDDHDALKHHYLLNTWLVRRQPCMAEVLMSDELAMALSTRPLLTVCVSKHPTASTLPCMSANLYIRLIVQTRF